MISSPRHGAPGAVVFAIFALLAVSPVPRAQTPPPVTPAAQGKAPTHAQVVKRLRITNAMVIPGSGVPAYGPVDILIEDGLIARVGVDTNKRWPAADAVIDARQERSLSQANRTVVNQALDAKSRRGESSSARSTP